ncbi:MAG: UvrD-helicase domain-containing protein [Clostridia bacterium]|nr:UvrD-helicase domain-containing protein [Clostridia bacterium]
MANFTQEQKAVIEAHGKTIVSASAGSGKTTVMIAKVLELIKSGVPVKQILAVTFTNKAAAQMKDKLRRELIAAVNTQGVSAEQKKYLKAQLTDVGTADFPPSTPFAGNSFARTFLKRA